MGGLRFRPGDLRREVVLGEPRLSPDRRLLAYTRKHIERGEYRTDVWLVEVAGGEARQVTRGSCNDTCPRISPDGRYLAYLCDEEGGVKQVKVADLEGGEPRRLTSMRHGITELEWLPDSTGLVVIAPDARSPVRVGDRAKGEPTARVLRHIDWRMDGEGLRERPAHLHVVPLHGRPRRLTSGRWSASCLRIEPGGRRAAFLADPRDDRDRRPCPQVFAVALSGGDPEQLTRSPGPVQRFSFDGDGTVVCLAHERVLPPDDEAPQVARVEAGTPVILTASLEAFPGCAETTHERLGGLATEGRVVASWIADGEVRDVVPRDADPVVDALDGDADLTAAVMSLGPRFGSDLYVVTRDGHRRVSDDGSAWLAPFAPVGFEEVWVPGPAGDIQTFVFSPPDAPEGPLATVLCFHGGPTWAWPVAPDLNTLLLAHAGYRVVRPNIRGSYDRGRWWMTQLVGRWGETDAEDVHAVVDALEQRGLIDSERIGCYGNSYGGFLVNWLVGTCDRFAAAVSQNGVTNQVAAFGNCDVGAPYSVSAGLGDVTDPDGVASLWRASPLRNAARVHTPLLILQGESDLRCPPSDNEQMFVALRWLGREVEYVLYPGSSHDMTTSARLDRRIDRARRMIGWFDRFMSP